MLYIHLKLDSVGAVRQDPPHSREEVFLFEDFFCTTARCKETKEEQDYCSTARHEREHRNPLT